MNDNSLEARNKKGPKPGLKPPSQIEDKGNHAAIIIFKHGIRYECLIDKADIPLVAGAKWLINQKMRVHKFGHNEDRKTMWLINRFLLRPPNGYVVDHINRDILDNRRSNLRIVTWQQSAMNRGIRSGKLFKGIHAYKTKDKSRISCWAARISLGYGVNDHRVIGYFKTPEEAAEAYDIEALKKYGEYACINFPEKRQEYLKANFVDNSK